LEMTDHEDFFSLFSPIGSCDAERLLDFRLFQLREEIAAFDAQLAAWIASARGRFAAWVAERDRRALG
jgi:hypothetical protein